MDLLPIIFFVMVAFAAGAGLILLSHLLAYKNKKVNQNDIYESGMKPVGSATRRYDVKFYLTAILFLVFDVEIIFLAPFALSYHGSEYKNLMIAELIFFVFIFIVGYLYMLFSKGLTWEE